MKKLLVPRLARALVLGLAAVFVGGMGFVSLAPAQAIGFAEMELSVSSFERNSPAPSFIATISGGVVGGGNIHWNYGSISLGTLADPWIFPATCPTTSGTATTTASLCGISSFKHDMGFYADLLSPVKVWKSAANTLSFEFQSVSTYGGTSVLQINFVANALTTPNVVGSSSVASTLDTDVSPNYAPYLTSATMKSAVAFDANGGSGSAMAQQLSSTNTALSANTFTAPANHSFAGWNTAQNGSGTPYTAAGTFPFSDASIASPTTLYAQWTPYPTVTFNSNGGTGTTASQQANTSTALNANGFTFARCAFTGWNTAQNGSGTAYAAGASFPFTSSATLYAQWLGDDGQPCSSAAGDNPADREQAAAATTAGLSSTGSSWIAVLMLIAAGLLAVGAISLESRRRLTAEPVYKPMLPVVSPEDN